VYAHTPPPGGGWHGLEDHLRSVAELASDFAVLVRSHEHV